MNAINYHSPSTPDQAVELAGDLGGDVAFLAGGQSLVNELKQRAIPAGTEIIDIGDFDELSYIESTTETVKIGSLTRHSELLHSDILRRELPVLPAMVAQVADVQVRNMGSIGGNIARADPAADYPVLLDVLDATFCVKSSTGERTIEAREFFIDYFQTPLETDELLTEIEIPIPDSETVTDFQKLATRAYLGKRADGRGDFALVNVAVALTFEAATCSDATIGVGAVQGTPIHAVNAEIALEGANVANIIPEDVGATAAAEIDPDRHDQRVSTEYKQTVIQTLSMRAISNCLAEVEDE